MSNQCTNKLRVEWGHGFNHADIKKLSNHEYIKDMVAKYFGKDDFNDLSTKELGCQSVDVHALAKEFEKIPEGAHLMNICMDTPDTPPTGFLKALLTQTGIHDIYMQSYEANSKLMKETAIYGHDDHIAMESDNTDVEYRYFEGTDISLFITDTMDGMNFLNAVNQGVNITGFLNLAELLELNEQYHRDDNDLHVFAYREDLDRSVLGELEEHEASLKNQVGMGM